MTIGNSLRSRTIGEIAAVLPGATAIFQKLKLDFCCGGDVPLATATDERGLNIVAVEEALAALRVNKPGPAPAGTGALIDYIVRHFHEAHRRDLPELVRLARKVEAVHAHHPEAPRGLADTLEAIRADLEEHMQQEETELFPLMRHRTDAGGLPPIAQMRQEHARHGELLHRLEILAHGFALPEGACRSWEAALCRDR